MSAAVIGSLGFARGGVGVSSSQLTVTVDTSQVMAPPQPDTAPRVGQGRAASRAGLAASVGLADAAFNLAEGPLTDAAEDAGLIEDREEFENVASQMAAAERGAFGSGVGGGDTGSSRETDTARAARLARERGVILPEDNLDKAAVIERAQARIGPLVGPQDIADQLEQDLGRPQRAGQRAARLAGKPRAKPKGRQRRAIALKPAPAAVETPTEQETKTEEKTGKCDCPGQLDSAGRTCGGRSAFSRSGGREPTCGGDPVVVTDSLPGPLPRIGRQANKIFRRIRDTKEEPSG